MTINEYKAALITIIEETNDEGLLQQWTDYLQSSLRQSAEETSGKTQPEPGAGKNGGKDDTGDYVVLESGLGINE